MDVNVIIIFHHQYSQLVSVGKHSHQNYRFCIDAPGPLWSFDKLGCQSECCWYFSDATFSRTAQQQKSQQVLLENQCAYINDSLGLHRVENVSHTETAVSLHLYSPPFQTCRTFDQRTGHNNSVRMTFWSKFGERTPYESTVSQENN